MRRGLRALALGAVLLALPVLACAQSRALEESIREAADRLNAAPVLALGETPLPGDDPRAASVMWVEAPANGLYTISLTGPGALELFAIPNAHGRYDGTTRPQRAARRGSAYAPPEIGPLLLMAGQPYLLSASAFAPASVILRQVESLGAPLPAPEPGAEIGPGSHLYATSDRLRLTLPPGLAVAVEVLAEARAKRDAKAGGATVPEAGFYPLRSDKPVELSVAARVGREEPAPLVLVRVGPVTGGYDESEPNDRDPDLLHTGAPFRGALLVRDTDLLEFSVADGTALDLSIAADQVWPLYTATLSRAEGSGWTDLWTREARRGALDGAGLALSGGSYRLTLVRKDEDPDPVDYTLRLTPGRAPQAGQEREPNDTQAAAMPLGDALQVRGTAAPDDVDMFAFSVPDASAGMLWRVLAVGAERLILHGPAGVVGDTSAESRRAVLDSLGLTPGDYVAEVRGVGDYALRVMELGPRPPGYEAEPNDRPRDGQRLAFGEAAEGSFHREGDTDHFLFRLDAGGAVQIDVTPADDGPMDAKLFQDGVQWGLDRDFLAGDAPYSYRAELPAGDWTLALRALERRTRGRYEVRVTRLADAGGDEPDDTPVRAVPMPRDGLRRGSVGAFDKVDHLFLPLPEGDGTALAACDWPEGERGARWSVWDWADTKVANPAAGMVVADYGPDLGGALRLELLGGTAPAAYACALRFAPTALPIPGTAAEEVPERLAPGAAVTVALPEARSDVTLSLDLPEGALGAVACVGPDGAAVNAEARLPEFRGVTAPRDARLGAWLPFRAAQGASIRLRGSAAPQLPFAVTCAMVDLDGLTRPSAMGPPAPFRMPEPEAEVAVAAVPGAPVVEPPGRAALLALAIPESQPSGDLPVEIAFGPLPELAGYAAPGQRFTVAGALTNTGTEALELALAARVEADGWRVALHPAALSLAAGGAGRVTLDVTAPPWLSAVLEPALVLRADAAEHFAAALAPIPVAAEGVPVGPVTYWSAPDALRGGLNVLAYGLGARMIRIGEETLDDKQMAVRAVHHDGLAPHIGVQPVGRDLTFRLAAPARLAGAMVQLRSTDPRAGWPAEAVFFTSADGEAWQPAGAGPLSAVHGPQYIVFDAPVEAAFLRVRFPRCRETCDRVNLQEVTAIAVPGDHPQALPPVNAADPALGGHVVLAEPNYEGNWNSGFLLADPERRNGGWTARNYPQRFVVAFHQNRAALLDRVVWVGNPDDEARAPGLDVAGSITGPAGPWHDLGRLPSPPAGAPRAELVFDAPVWARYLRFTLDPGEAGGVGPDAVEALEVPGTSVLGLWEDDQPRAAYEAGVDAPVDAAVPPSGGADAANAVALAFGAAVASSVVLERNEDWWRLTVPEGPMQEVALDFDAAPLQVAVVLADPSGAAVPLREAPAEQGTRLSALLAPGDYLLRVHEPPRSVVISWDTSGSVAAYIPRTLAAVRTWGRSLQPGRDALQLLPFGNPFLLQDWAETPEELAPALRTLPANDSSEAEAAMLSAAGALSTRRGARGVVIITDAETPMDSDLWPTLLRAQPKVVALSIDSDGRENAAIMMDWAAVNGGRFQRVTGALGLADGMDMAAALFRAPKPYRLTVTAAPYVEPEGEAQLTLTAIAPPEAVPVAPGGAIEVILDASGSMLQRLDGRRRIQIAHEALEKLVRETLPEGTPFAFRAFGLEEDACRSELLLPLAPLDRAQAAATITAVPAINLAKTAIGASLLAAGADLAGSTPPRVVVLVTDGEETCDGDPEAAIETLRAQGLDVRVNIVGFAIDDAGLAETFRAWAAAGGGSYFDARNAAALDGAISQALVPRFEILRTHMDGRVEQVGQVALGETVTVPAGRLSVVPASAAVGAALEVKVAPDAGVVLGYRPDTGLEAAGE